MSILSHKLQLFVLHNYLFRGIRCLLAAAGVSVVVVVVILTHAVAAAAFCLVARHCASVRASGSVGGRTRFSPFLFERVRIEGFRLFRRQTDFPYDLGYLCVPGALNLCMWLT